MEVRDTRLRSNLLKNIYLSHDFKAKDVVSPYCNTLGQQEIFTLLFILHGRDDSSNKPSF